MRRNIGKLGLVAVAALMGAGAASAADMAVKAPAYKAAPVATYNWTGCYLGGYVGGATPSRSIRTRCA